MSQEQTFRHIIDELFQIAQPGNIKSSLWQAYQRALKESPTTLEQETEQAVSLAAEQAQRELPYTEVIEARPSHYHFHSKRWYIEVDVQHLEPEEGAATALYRVWKRQDGTMAAMKVDIRETELEPEQGPDWRTIDEQAIYHSDRNEMGRSPRQAIDNLLTLPPLN